MACGAGGSVGGECDLHRLLQQFGGSLPHRRPARSHRRGRPVFGSTAPAGTLLCYGQAISRTAYAGLFAALSTTYGTGDGSTTFNLPDLRGRVVAGKDNMGGSAASRLTGTSMSPDGNTLGATGGFQQQNSGGASSLAPVRNDAANINVAQEHSHTVTVVHPLPTTRLRKTPTHAVDASRSEFCLGLRPVQISSC